MKSHHLPRRAGGPICLDPGGPDGTEDFRRVKVAIPSTIGRFIIERELGRGSQGVVFLARDPHLERRVAIKTLGVHLGPGDEKQEQLMREARTVGRLQHPNIITLYEAGQENCTPFLVFEYVEGESLRDLLRKQGPPPVHRTLRMMRKILSGIAFAHEAGVIHRDLSPANILLDGEETPRIVDFGLSILEGKDADPAGTPCYMSPEHFSKGGPDPRSDIFSLGLILYEMLAGRPAFTAENHFPVMYRIAHEPLPLPSLANEAVDRELDLIVQKAVEKDPERRYRDALEMKEALDRYLESESEKEPIPTEPGHSTLAFLLRRMRSKSDFPTFSRYVTEINRLASGSGKNYASASELANAILKDFSLTNKLLRLVNSAFYGQFSGGVTTVSRAVVVLGFEQVKAAAMSLMLFEHLKSRAQSEELKGAAMRSLLSGMIARELASSEKGVEAEEAFICAMLKRLGKHLAIFYFPEEFREAKDLMTRKGITESAASRSVLGMSYEELGVGIAATWNFPNKILHSMRGLPKGPLPLPASESGLLQQISSFSNSLCDLLAEPPDAAPQKALGELLKRFQKGLPLDRETVCELLEAAWERVRIFADILRLDPDDGALGARLSKFMAATRGAAGKDRSGAARDRDISWEAMQIGNRPGDGGESTDPRMVLINGIQDITETLLGNFDLNQVLSMVMETLYRGLGFHRVLFCVLEPNQKRMSARFGLGPDVERLTKAFSFGLQGAPDVFRLALSRGKDVAIDQAKDPRIRSRIPDWYLEAVAAPAFALFPILLDGRPIGLFYADRKESGRVLTTEQANFARALCNQAVLAFKQKG